MSPPSFAERVASFVTRRATLLFALWIVHGFLIHLLVIGFTSWDGFAYRVPPIIELAQHGSYGMEKYNQWAFAGYIPFVELANAPFVAIFKMPGVIMGFPLVVFPLCLRAVYGFVKELADGDRTSATFGAIAYAAIPVVSQQPYSGLIDFAVVALVAFFFESILRTRAADVPSRRMLARIAVATTLLTLARMTTVFVIAVVFPFVAWVLFFEWDGDAPLVKKARLVKKRALLLVVAAIVTGALPIVAIQIWKFIQYGSPLHPYQFQFLGVKIGGGVSTKELFSYAGLRDETASAYFKSFVSAWIWPEYWPPGLLSDSRHFGGGLILYLVLAALPFYRRAATRIERWLLLGCAVASLFARDFWLPRWSYTLDVAYVLILGRTLGSLAADVRSASPRRASKPVFLGLAALLLAHLARPEFDLYMMRQEPGGMGPRLNVAGSPYFPPGPWVVDMYPDMNARFVIVEMTSSAFVLQLYGRRLTNEVTGTVKKTDLGEGCSGLAASLERDASTLFVDDEDFTKGCERECALVMPSGCRAWKIKPADARAAATLAN